MPHALIIDDDTNNLGVLAELLALEGVTHTKVQNPLTLPLVLQTLPKVDVVFLDLEMPGLDGYQIFEILRAHPLFAATPIVAHTVHVSEINTAQQVGFNSFLAKPLNDDLFPQQLRLILGGKAVWAAV